MIAIDNNIPKQPIFLKGYSMIFDKQQVGEDNGISRDMTGDGGATDDGHCVYIQCDFLNNVDINSGSSDGNLQGHSLALPANGQNVVHVDGLNIGFLPSKDIHKNIKYQVCYRNGTPRTTWGNDLTGWTINLFFQYNRNLVF